MEYGLPQRGIESLHVMQPTCFFLTCTAASLRWAALEIQDHGISTECTGSKVNRRGQLAEDSELSPATTTMSQLTLTPFQRKLLSSSKHCCGFALTVVPEHADHMKL